MISSLICGISCSKSTLIIMASVILKLCWVCATPELTRCKILQLYWHYCQYKIIMFETMLSTMLECLECVAVCIKVWHPRTRKNDKDSRLMRCCVSIRNMSLSIYSCWRAKRSCPKYLFYLIEEYKKTSIVVNHRLVIFSFQLPAYNKILEFYFYNSEYSSNHA